MELNILFPLIVPHGTTIYCGVSHSNKCTKKCSTRELFLQFLYSVLTHCTSIISFLLSAWRIVYRSKVLLSQHVVFILSLSTVNVFRCLQVCFRYCLSWFIPRGLYQIAGKTAFLTSVRPYFEILYFTMLVAFILILIHLFTLVNYNHLRNTVNYTKEQGFLTSQ